MTPLSTEVVSVLKPSPTALMHFALSSSPLANGAFGYSLQVGMSGAEVTTEAELLGSAVQRS